MPLTCSLLRGNPRLSQPYVRKGACATMLPMIEKDPAYIRENHGASRAAVGLVTGLLLVAAIGFVACSNGTASSNDYADSIATAVAGSTIGDAASGADADDGVQELDCSPTELSVIQSSVSPSGFTLVWGKPSGYGNVADYQVTITAQGSTRTFMASSDENAASARVGSFYAQGAGDLMQDGATVAPAQGISQHCFHVSGLPAGCDCAVEVRSCFADGTLSNPATVQQTTAPEATSVLNVADFGAVGDGLQADDATGTPSSGTLDTAAIQAAIDACPAGGTVLIPAGGTFTTGPLTLHSDMTLDVEGTLLATADASQYPNPADSGGGKGQKSASLITASSSAHCSNIRLVGHGTIDGNGWCVSNAASQTGPDALFPCYTKGGQSNVQTTAANHLAAAQYERFQSQGQSKAYATRSNLLSFSGVDNLYLGAGLTVQNPSMHTISMSGCSNACIDSLTVSTYDCNNADGLDWSNSTGGLTVIASAFNTGDDGICFAASSSTSGNAWIFDNYFGRGHGSIALGSNVQNGIENVLAEDNVFDGCGAALCGKARGDSAGGAWNVTFRDSAIADVIDNEGVPFLLTSSYDGTAVGDENAPSFHDIVIERCTVFGAKNAFIDFSGAGKPSGNTSQEAGIDRHIVVRNVSFAADPAVKTSGGNASTLRWLSDSVFDNVTFFGIDAPWNIADDARPTLSNVEFANGTLS